MTQPRSQSSYTPNYDFQPTEVFVIVDGISTGKNIAPMLRGYGYPVIHVLSDRAHGLNLSQKAYDYIANYKESDGFENLIRDLKKYQIRAIIPGAEAGVNLTDRLNETLQLKTRNDFTKSNARQNKFLMQKTLHDAGMKAAKQQLIKNLPNLIEWTEQNGLPIVLKPIHSSGTDGVHFCHTLEDVAIAFKKLLGNKTVYQQINEEIVAQELLVGDEFMVNTVSYDNEIKITEIFLAKKKVVNHAPLYDYTILISEDDERFQAIADYVKKALHALGLKYGAAHTEIIWTKKGPTLVEVNARVMGAYDMSAITAATGTNQVAELVKVYMNNGFLKSELKQNSHAKYTLASFLMTEQKGTIVNDPDLLLLKSIPGCHSIKFLYKPSDQLPPTFENPIVNLPGIVNFVADKPETLLKQHEELRKREKIFFSKLLLQSPLDCKSNINLLFKPEQNPIPETNKSIIFNKTK